MSHHLPSTARGILLLATVLAAGPAWAAGASTLKVMTYNIAAGEDGLDDLIGTIKEATPDIVALQEVDKLTRRSGLVDQAAEIASALSMKYVFRRHFKYQGGEFGLALLSRHPIKGAERHPVARSNLALLRAWVHTPSGPINTVVVHLHPTMPFDDEKNQKASSA